jgi:EAL domain-containing protein (putative c-di-GMP-specific phosphodiesterase class I)/CheY-like chemotaxis protein
MGNQAAEESPLSTTFGRRKVRPRVCIADGKQHIRTFLAEAFEELGFIAWECANVDELGAVLDRYLPDLIVFGLSAGGGAGVEMLRTLAARTFEGKILVFGPRDLPVTTALRDLGAELGLAMLPILPTPFDDKSLRNSVATLLTAEAPSPPPVDVAEALSMGWLELWYQPKVSTRTLALSGAEALTRMRHPEWGVVPPAYFIPADGDPHFGALSDFVTVKAIEDWHYFLAERGHVEIAINLHVDFLQDLDSVRSLCARVPEHPGFEGLIVQINGTEALRDLARMQELAKQLRFHNIGLSIDDIGPEWLSFADLRPFPFVEIKVHRGFVTGCTDDRLKRTACRQILDFAHAVGARTVAEGVERRADFFCVRELGFDLAQGLLFGKPMPARKFARTILGRPVNLSQ